ncbi:MAG: nucleoside hydrolase [Spirochaetia bacterium]|jgi:inosine-uridine nucleoside N-ribohydrolase
MNYSFTVPKGKRIRLIINTDAKNEADDQFAIVHALLTPKFDVKALISAHFGNRKNDRSMEESFAEINHILDLMDRKGKHQVLKGAPKALHDERTPQVSEGAQFIVTEAMRDDQMPLFVIFLGPLTEMASALLMEPRIADRLTCIWIGGGAYPNGAEEFNLSNDIHGANVVFKSRVHLWQATATVFSTVRVSLAELQYKVKPCGRIGNYLFQQMVDLNDAMGDRPEWPLGESWSLGDSPAIALLLDQHVLCYDWIPAPIFTPEMRYTHGQNNRPIRVYTRVDTRFLLEDLFCKLALNFPRA